jgi:hypothetical protein
MSDEGSIENANELLKLGPTGVRRWVESVRAGERVPPTDFNWLGLAEASAGQARRGVEPGCPIGNDSIEWGLAGISCYEWLADTHRGNARSFTLSAMFLRAYLISRCGVKPGDSILDPQVIVHWFFNSLGMSVDEAVAKSAIWRDRLKAQAGTGADRREVTELLELRHIKLRLDVLRFLSEAGVPVPDASVRAWLDAHDKLI